MDIYLFSGTHWDREWYQTFQGFRMRLVKMMDELIEILETRDDYGVFHFDGQTIVLEDYLEIRPENKERLEKLIKSGKLVIGPWYCMPDEMLISGESLIKNLQKGFKLSREFGVEPLKSGYICDIFGHIAQMPQIFDKMGINSAILWRGIGDTDLPMFFDWKAPDGSTVRTVRQHPRSGYGSFAIEVLGRDPLLVDDIPDDVLRERLKKHVDEEIERANIPYIYLGDAVDHANCHKHTGKYIKILKELYPDATIHHENIENLFNSIKDEKGLPEKNGELYGFTKFAGRTIMNTPSARPHLKIANDKVQTLLEKWVHPLYAFGHTTEPETYLDVANTYLLKNHPHDSICGCSLDRVHENMMFRYNQSEEIANEIIFNFKSGRRVKDEESKDMVIEILNPLPYAEKTNVEVGVLFDKEFPTYGEGMGYEQIASFRLYDMDGNEVDYGISKLEYNQRFRTHDQVAERGHYYTLTFTADLPAMGSVKYRISPCNGEYTRKLKRLTSGRNFAENDYISFEINCDGSINLTDKRTGKIYRNLLSLVDSAEIGDGWIHVPPVNDREVVSNFASIKKIEDNAARVVFEITQKMMIPEKMMWLDKGYYPSDHEVEVIIKNIVTLTSVDKHIKIKTTVINNAEDHRVSVLFPTGIDNGKYTVNQAFSFVERRSGIYLESENSAELPCIERQMGGIIYTKNEKGGFAIIAKAGLHEAGAMEDGTIKMTLLRAFPRVVLQNLQTEGQVKGETSYEYLILPFDKNMTDSELQIKQYLLSAGYEHVYYKGKLTNDVISDMEIVGRKLVYSTANPKENGIEIRVYNPINENVADEITFAKDILKASFTDFDDNVLSDCEVSGKSINVSLKPFEIATIKVEF